MAQSVFAVQRVDDDSWRRELCPDCGARLIGFAECKDHGPRHGWGPDWLAARVRAGRPGAIIRGEPGVEGGAPGCLAVDAVDAARWKAGIRARSGPKVHSRCRNELGSSASCYAS